MDTSIACNDSDSEVFEVATGVAQVSEAEEGGHSQTGVDARTNTSSSSSSCDDPQGKASRSLHESPEPLHEGSGLGHTISISGQTVEWRPESKSDDSQKNGRTRKTPSDNQQSPQNGVHDSVHGGTVTVMIDPPNDEEQLFAESADNVASGSKLVFRHSSTSEEETIDLFADLDDSDLESEEAEGTALMKTCLLSR